MSIDVSIDDPVDAIRDALEPNEDICMTMRKWQHIAEAFAHRIDSGEWTSARPLPRIIDLAAEFDVNRHTVRRAMDHLRQQGRIVVTQGRGSFVVDPLIDHRLGRYVRLRGGSVKDPEDIHAVTRAHRTILANESEAQRLGIRKGRRLLLIETTSARRNIPVSLASHRLPFRSGVTTRSILSHLEHSGGSFSALFASWGATRYSRHSTRISARMPSAEQQKLLQLESGIALLHTDGIDIDESGRPLQLVSSDFPGNRVQLVLEDND